MRHISKDIFKDSFLGELPIEFRMLWIGMIVALADDQGRMIDDPMEIAKEIFRYDAHIEKQIIERGLVLFAKHKKIVRYAAGSNGNGRRLIQIVKWWEFQKSSRWAARSKYSSPPKWIDRIRTHEAGSGQTPVVVNWNQPGGFQRLVKRMRSGSTTSVQPQDSREEEEEEEEEEENRGKRRGRAPSHPPTPSRSDATRRVAGGLVIELKEDPQFQRLNQNQKQAAERAHRILSVASLRNPLKVNSLSLIMATRSSFQQVTEEVLAAFASSYADDKAENKTAVAAYRIEHDLVDPKFLSPKTWRRLPKEILTAAGINDIDAYIRNQKIRSFMNG